jgi:hypothetical protein
LFRSFSVKEHDDRSLVISTEEEKQNSTLKVSCLSREEIFVDGIWIPSPLRRKRVGTRLINSLTVAAKNSGFSSVKAHAVSIGKLFWPTMGMMPNESEIYRRYLHLALSLGLAVNADDVTKPSLTYLVRKINTLLPEKTDQELRALIPDWYGSIDLNENTNIRAV